MKYLITFFDTPYLPYLMRPIDLKALRYFNYFYLLFCLIFPLAILIQHHGWFIGLVGYLGVLVGVIFLAEVILKKLFHLLFIILFTFFIFYTTWLTFGLSITVWMGSLLTGIFLVFNFWSYYLNINNIQKHRTGIELTFQFPLVAPEGLKQKKDVNYFDPDAFEITALETIIIPLSLEYIVEGKTYQQSFDYYWKAAPWENKTALSDYDQNLSGQSFLLQYHPNNPEELLEIVSKNYLSTFEAFIQEQFKKNLVNNFLQLAFFLFVAVIFHFYW